MSSLQWFLVVLGVFATVFTAWGMWNKDTVGAIKAAAGVFAIFLLLFFTAGCAVSPERRPWMEAGFGYDFQHTVGSDPACIVRVRAPIGFGPIQPDWLVAGYTHHSSCADFYDRNTVDQVEIVAKIPLGRDK